MYSNDLEKNEDKSSPPEHRFSVPSQLKWSVLARAAAQGLMSSAKYIRELNNVGAGLCAARVNAAARIQLDDIMISVLTEYSQSCVKTAWGSISAKGNAPEYYPLCRLKNFTFPRNN